MFPKGIFFIVRMQEIKGDNKAKEQPIVAKIFNEIAERFAWLTVEMHEYALNYSLYEMADAHVEGNLLSERGLKMLSKVDTLLQADVIYLESVHMEQEECNHRSNVYQYLREAVGYLCPPILNI